MKDIDFAALERLTVEGAKSVLSSLGIKMKAKAKKTEQINREVQLTGSAYYTYIDSAKFLMTICTTDDSGLNKSSIFLGKQKQRCEFSCF